MNKVILTGNLANDPESRTTQSGIAMCTFRLAVQRRFANQQGVREADFFSITTWRQTAELCARYLSKGRKVLVEGTLQNRSYDAQDGTKRYVTDVIADNVEFLSPKDQSASIGRQDDAPPPSEPPAYETNMSEFKEVDDDELPF